jgi:hypothetical protein
MARNSSPGDAAAAVPRGRLKTGPFRPLHDYLRDRFADRVVLTFTQIEDLLGAALPAEATADPAWWDESGRGEPHRSDAWVLAHRTASANMRARTVTFDRIG